MIIKFDHISYSCTYEEEERILSQLCGEEIFFREEQIQNISGKTPYFNINHKRHNLTILQSTNGIPIEITAYQSCMKEQPGYDIQESVVCIYTSEVRETERLLSCLGFQVEQVVLNKSKAIELEPILSESGSYEIVQDNVKTRIWSLKPFLDNALLRVKILQLPVAKTRYYLDNTGYSSLAFIVSNIRKDREKLMGLGYQVGEIEPLTLNNHVLEICFLQGQVGEIIELIGFKSEPA